MEIVDAQVHANHRGIDQSIAIMDAASPPLPSPIAAKPNAKNVKNMLNVSDTIAKVPYSDLPIMDAWRYVSRKSLCYSAHLIVVSCFYRKEIREYIGRTLLWLV